MNCPITPPSQVNVMYSRQYAGQLISVFESPLNYQQMSREAAESRDSKCSMWASYDIKYADSILFLVHLNNHQLW